ncbi:MAG: F0F1 ATP synthase subunit gamma [Candidatus Levyibacteriota bacterium]
MQSRTALNSEFTTIDTLKTLAQSYEQISIMRIQRVRGSVLTTRDFLTGLADIYKDVKKSYKEEVERLTAHHKNSKIMLSGLIKNGKTVSVLLSSNNKLYGDIVSRVFNLFSQDIRENPNVDIVVIGKVGKSMMDTRMPKYPYTFFDLPDQNASLTDLAAIFKYVIPYEKILVYYGRFLNIVSQEPAVSEISGEESLIDQPIEKEEKEVKTPFFFEPNLQRILGFFEDQVFASILKQVVDESELSRLASRIKSMEDSLQSIEKQERILKKTYLRSMRLLENNKQIQRLAGLSVWQTE